MQPLDMSIRARCLDIGTASGGLNSPSRSPTHRPGIFSVSSQRRLPLLDCCGYEELAWTVIRDSREETRQYTAQRNDICLSA